ncbi:hypothetical protein [Variovorax sp. EL159]|uniref:hypothetical protein n=1 Tax=Variovorax sp. EL159 TaxID=1566270 RepID=UPI00088F6F59|nr:hypothetical protein [Variovorax sp. EL159]SCX56722.1 hypothetical protein SAMN03159363_1737 [Variovorax sp. EL159]
MQVGKCAALCLLAFACSAGAAGAFKGTFSGTGRACNGTLHVRSQTIEWKSSFSTCRRSAYEVLETSQADGRQRMAFRLKAGGSKCLYEVLALEQVDGTDWTADGYPSLEAFRKKDLPDWRDSPLPERLVLECPMTRLD